MIAETEIRTGEECRNCGAPVEHAFCPHCGQEKRHRPLSLWLLFREFLEDTFSADSRLFRSIVPLMIRPGFLTNEYIAGRHARYISPFRMYLFASVAFFFLVAYLSPRLHPEETSGKPKISLGYRPASVQRPLGGPSLPDYDAAQRNLPPGKRDPWFARRIKRQAIKLSQMQPAAIGKLFTDTYQEEWPKLMFLLVPVFAFILKILYFRRSRFYVEHLVFGLHFHAFAFIALALGILVPVEFITVIVALSPLAYLPKAMRVVYRQSRIKTFFKMGFLLASYGFVTLIGAGVIALVAMFRA